MTTSNAPRWRRWLVVLLTIAVFLELLWLVAANILLARDSTQDWLSDLRPERARISWDRAWSWYPGRVSVTGAKVSGQTAKYQWQADAQAVDGHVALLPLLQRKVVIHRAQVSDGAFRQRPRLKPDGSNLEVSQWFPPVRGYELTQEGERRTPRRKPWRVVINKAKLSGNHSAWIHRFQAQLKATAEGKVAVRAQGGPLHVQIDDLDVNVNRAWADENETIFDGGVVSGELTLGPYRYRENRGARALRYLDTDLDLDLNSDDFSFVQLFLLRYPSLDIDGQGKSSGKLIIAQGRVADGTEIEVAASDMAVSQSPFRITGEGTVSLEGKSGAQRPFLIAMDLGNLGIFHSDDGAPLISGNNLQIQLEDDGDLVPGNLLESAKPHDFIARVDIANARIDDAQTFNRFLPEESPMTFTDGQTDVTAKLTFAPDRANGEIILAGENLTARFEQQDVSLDLRFDGVIEGGKPLDRKFNIAGSVIELTRARVLGEATSLDAENWSATANITDGTIDLQDVLDMAFSATLAVSDSRPLSALFINNGGPKWIARRLSVDGLNGGVRLRIRDRNLYVPDAQLAAEELEFAVKGMMAKPDQQGMVYLRYKQLDALLNFEAGQRDIVLIGPRRKFEAYSVTLPPATSPPLP